MVCAALNLGALLAVTSAKHLSLPLMRTDSLGGKIILQGGGGGVVDDGASGMSSGKGGLGGAPLTNARMLVYTADVLVGTPAQHFRLVVDTGSADLWVLSSASETPKVSTNRYFDSAKSSTWAALGNNKKGALSPWEIFYARGRHCAGFAGTETVELAGFQVASQAMAFATNCSSNVFSDGLNVFDGILGLGLTELAVTGAPTFLDKLKSEELIERKQFSLLLTSGNAEGSTLFFGEPPVELSPTGFTWTSVFPVRVSGGMWMTAVDAVLADGRAIPACSLSVCPVLFDSGSSFLGIPGTLWEAFSAKLRRNRPDCSDTRGFIRCKELNNREGLPVLTFVLQGREFDVPPSLYFYDGLMGVQRTGGDPTSRTIILGDVFLRGHFVTFDAERMRIGVANPASSPVVSAAFAMAVAVAVLCAMVVAFARVRAKHGRVLYEAVARMGGQDDEEQGEAEALAAVELGE